MPINSLFVINQKYSWSSSIAITVVKNSNVKITPTLDKSSLKEDLPNEVAIKKMITALEQIVKVLEKKVYDLKKNKKSKIKKKEYLRLSCVKIFY